MLVLLAFTMPPETRQPVRVSEYRWAPTEDLESDCRCRDYSSTSVSVTSILPRVALEYGHT
ncbi:Uncharacterised protein [Mycobacteroides abscessus subsp. abscessus]|nr:Uncharacterised protein [Mycobacteroides abscessus subsp. abscessus]